MIDLDDIEGYSQADPSDYLAVIERFPDQLRDAIERASTVESLPSPEGVGSIAVLGMGGSGISGDVAKAILSPRIPVFVETVKGYELPAWVGTNTLVFAVSYSGDTEETLQAFETSRDRGSRMVVISTGGKLTELAREYGVAVVEIQKGFQPRAALGYLSIPILVVCQRIGIAPSLSDELAETVDLAERRSDELQRKAGSDSNFAKRLASRLLGKIPLIYGTEGFPSVAAYRWKCQFNECSKVPAWSAAFPELNHNEIVGWNRLREVTAESTALVVLRHSGEHPQNAKRIEITIPLIEKHLSFVEEVWANGESALSRFVDLTYAGDFVSTYLAIAQGVDPAPVDVIASLKRKLSE